MSRHIQRTVFDEVVFHGMRTASPRMLHLFELIRRVARTDSPVLVRGETGTGKELVAGAIHHLSARAPQPYRALNCALLTAELLASELFGHVRGAFTGAVRDRAGLFQLADKGTLFLDEVAEIPVGVQARLLRAVQEQQFIPVGATEPVRVDVRIVSATHRALRQEVAEGRFREDLMYRLRVVPLFLPRLAERDRDVELLAWHFVDHFNARGLRQVDTVAVDAWDALCGYAWPGNVRELNNVIESAFALGEGPVLTLDELTPELRGEAPTVRASPDGLDGEERERILEALRLARGRKGDAATLLGMSRSTLWRKLKEHRL